MPSQFILAPMERGCVAFIHLKTGSSVVSITEQFYFLANSLSLFKPQASHKQNINDNA